MPGREQEERVFGPYRLVKQIAVGGMAEIYLARARGIGGFEKVVAIKVIHPNYSADDHFIEMLIEEAKISVQLNHVNIGQIFDLGRIGDTYYIAMEYIDGTDLFRLLRRASERAIDMPIEIAAFVTQEVCSGLDYAHRKRDEKGRPLGIIHRDISPQNILLSHSGEVKIVDFGIAKAALRARQTAVGVIKGKYYYMSPEQAWGDPVDHRSDIFSAGILLYEMLSGQMLYLEDDLGLLLDRVRKANIQPPSSKRAAVPAELDGIVMRALAKRPADRWQSAQELGSALTRFLFGFAPDISARKLAQLTRQVMEPDPQTASRAAVAAAGGAAAARDSPGTSPVMSREEFSLREHSLIVSPAVTPAGRRVLERPAGGSPPVGERSPAAALAAAPAAPAGRLASDDGDDGEEFGDDHTVVDDRPPAWLHSTSQVSASGPMPLGSDPGLAAPSPAAAPAAGSVAAAGGRVPLPRQPGSADHEITKPRVSLPRPEAGPGARSEEPRIVAAALPVRALVPQPASAMSPAGGTAPPPLPPGSGGSAEGPKRPGPAVPSDFGDDEPTTIQNARLAQAATGPAQVARPTPLSTAAGPTTPPGASPQGASPETASPAPPPSAPLPASPQLSPQPSPQASAQPSPQPSPQASAQPSPQPSPQASAQPSPQPSPPSSGQPPPPLSPRPPRPSWPPPPVFFDDALSAADLTVPLEKLRPRRLWPTVIIAFFAFLAAALLTVSFWPSGPVHGTLEIVTVPEGADVRLDELKLADRSPLRVVDVETAVPHKVAVDLLHHEPWEREVSFAEGQSFVRVLAILKPMLGSLRVVTSPPGAELLIGGRSYGRTPRRVDGLPRTSDIRLELRLPGHRRVAQIYPWGKQRDLSIYVTLERTERSR